MTLEFLAGLIATQGGAIVSASECDEEEIELARRTSKLVEFGGHTFVYRGKIWMAVVNNLINQERARRAERELSTNEVHRDKIGTE